MTRLSRGAARCLNLLKWYASRHSQVYPYVATLGRHLEVCERQVKRYLAELRGAGLIAVTQAGPHPASYQVLAVENVPSMSPQCPLFRPASLYDFKNRENIKRRPMGKETEERHRKTVQKIKEDFGEVAINGKKSDPALIERLAWLLDLEDVPSFSRALGAKIKARRADSWGIAVVIAQDFAARRKTG